MTGELLKTQSVMLALCWLMLTVGSWGQELVFTRANNTTNNINIPAGEVWKIVGWKTTGPRPYETSTDDVYYLGDLENKYFQVAGGFSLFGTGGASASQEYFEGMRAIGEINSVATPRPAIGAILIGPQTLTAEAAVLNTTNGYILVLEKVPTRKSSFNTGSSSVVIPATSFAEVDIKMEQSTDNVTWTECLPGTYNSSTVKRFFRLRAVER